MAELEKMKQARQNIIIMNNRPKTLPKETLKPLNSSVMSNKLHTVNKVEEKIALSRYKFTCIFIVYNIWVIVPSVP